MPLHRFPSLMIVLLLSAALAACDSSSSSAAVNPTVPGNGDISNPPGGGNGGEIPVSRNIHSFANACFVLQAESGSFVVADDESYSASADSVEAASAFYMKPTRLGSYLLLSSYVREPNEPGHKQLLGISDPLGEFLDEFGNFIGEAAILVMAIGDITDLLLDPTPLSGDPLRDIAAGISAGGESVGDQNISPALAMVTEASDLAVWNLSALDHERFELTADATGQRLAAAPDGSLGLTDSDTAATLFQLLPTSGCDAYPEAELNARLVDENQPPRIYWDDGAGDNIFGWVDAHAHITAYEFIGGRINYGATHHKFGVDHALGNCEVNHGPQGSTGTVEMVTSEDAMSGHDTVGWPTYSDWPRHASLQHHQSYYRWIERTFLSGQKILVNLITHNELLCQVVPQKKNECDGMANTRLQAKRTYELQDYIDAQSGGPGEGWFRVVTSPQQAREVIADGKMAVVLGIEMSKIFNCGEFLDVPECTQEEMIERLDEVHALGARVVFPIHKFDNAFGGHLPHSGFALGPILTAGNLVETGHPLEVEECPLDDNGDDHFPEGYEANNPRSNPEGIIDFLLANFDYLWRQAPDSGGTPLEIIDPRDGTSTEHLCNIRGLTPFGAVLIQELMARGMMIDLDHMSRQGVVASMLQLKAQGYPAISSHDWMGSDSLLNAIANGGGFISRFARGGRDQWIERLTGMAQRYNNDMFMGGGIASDVNGIAQLPRDPRIGSADSESKISYPFLSYDGRVEFDKQVTGDRVFDLYDDDDIHSGVSHYGLYADFLADAQQFGGADAEQGLDIFFRSAEAFLRMWEKAHASGNP